MTLVNPETGEIVDRPTYSEVRDSIAVAREAGAKFFEQIVWQVERRAWEVLGYADWDAMREAEYADMGVVVPSSDRPEISTRLRRTGLTQKQIATSLGVSESTVRNDLNRKSAVDLPLTVETSRGTRPTSYTPRYSDATNVAPVRDRTPDPEPTCERPTPTVDTYVAADNGVQLAGWRKNFMAAIAKSGEVMLFTPADVAEKADVDLVNELERLSQDLNNYVSRVRARRPAHRLTAIKGGAQ